MKGLPLRKTILISCDQQKDNSSNTNTYYLIADRIIISYVVTSINFEVE